MNEKVTVPVAAGPSVSVAVTVVVSLPAATAAAVGFIIIEAGLIVFKTIPYGDKSGNTEKDTAAAQAFAMQVCAK